jgi:hypothetical protein
MVKFACHAYVCNGGASGAFPEEDVAALHVSMAQPVHFVQFRETHERVLHDADRFACQEDFPSK